MPQIFTDFQIVPVYEGLTVCYLTCREHFSLHIVLESEDHCPCFTDEETVSKRLGYLPVVTEPMSNSRTCNLIAPPVLEIKVAHWRLRN